MERDLPERVAPSKSVCASSVSKYTRMSYFLGTAPTTIPPRLPGGDILEASIKVRVDYSSALLRHRAVPCSPRPAAGGPPRASVAS